MDATKARQQITEPLLCELDESNFVDPPMLKRIESMISSREELDRYVEILVAKVQDDAQPPSTDLLDRVEGLLKLMQQLDRLEDPRQGERRPLPHRIASLPTF